MRPVLFHMWGLKIYSYPAMLYLGLVAGITAGNLAAHTTGINAFRVFIATFILLIPALIGARLLWVLSYWELYRHDLGRIWNRSEGGAAQYGGLASAIVFSVPLLSLLHLPFGAFWDVAIITILVGMIFGRLGCLLNGCCAGRPSRAWYSVNLPNCAGIWERRIPTQCLEAAFAALLLATAIFLKHLAPFAGALFLIIIGAYACGRLILESTREPLPGARRFNIYCSISVAMILLVVIALIWHWP